MASRLSILVCVVLWVAAVGVDSVVYVPNAGIDYGTPAVALARVCELIPRIGWAGIWSALGIYDAAFLASITIASVAVSTAARARPLRGAFAAAAALVLLFPLNLGGLLGVVFEVLLPQPIDGEFLYDGGAQASVYGIWTVVACVLSWQAMRRQSLGSAERALTQDV